MINNSEIRAGVSIVICCYNSASRLPETLQHIAEQEVAANISWEVIVVDNASTDNTQEIAKKEWTKYGISHVSFRIVMQPIPGLSAAREKGIAEAQFEYILLCDDDNWLCPTYVQTAFEIMKNNAQIGILGGKGEAVSEINFPHWFSTYQGGYAVGVQALNSGNISSRGYVWGAGMIFSKSIYQKLRNAGFKHILSDRKGKNLTSGGDSEICQWFLLAKYQLWYDERLAFNHFIPKERLEKEYYQKLLEGFNLSSAVISTYQSIVQIHQYPLNLFKKVHRFSRALIGYSLGIILRNQNRKEVALLNLEIYNLLPFLVFNQDAHYIKKATDNFLKTNETLQIQQN